MPDAQGSQPQGGASGQSGPPPKKRAQKDDDDAPSFDYRVDGTAAIKFVSFAILIDAIDWIPFTGMVLKPLLAAAFWADGISPVMVYRRLARTPASKTGKAQGKLDEKMDEFEKKENEKKSIFDALTGPGVSGWVLSYILDSLPISSILPWTTWNTFAIIRESRKIDRMDARERHFSALYAKHDAEDAAWSRRMTAMRQRQIGRGPAANAQREGIAGAANKFRTRTETNLGNLDNMTPEQRRLIMETYGKGKNRSSTLDSPARTFKNDAERAAYMEELKKRGGNLPLGPDGKALDPLAAEKLAREREALGLGIAAMDGIVAADALKKTDAEIEAEKEKAAGLEGAQPGVDGVVPGGAIAPAMGPDDLPAAERKRMVGAWDDYRDSGGHLGYHDFARGLSRDDYDAIIAGRPVRKPKLYSGTDGVDGVVAAHKDPLRASDIEAERAGQLGPDMPSPPDEFEHPDRLGPDIPVPRDHEYRRIEKDIVEAIPAVDFRAVGASEDVRAALANLKEGRAKGLTDPTLERMKREVKDPQVIRRVSEIRGDYPASGLSDQSLEVIASNAALGNDINLTAHEMIRGYPGAMLSLEQLEAVEKNKTVPAELRQEIAKLKSENASAITRAVNSGRQALEWTNKKSDAEFDAVLERAVSAVKAKNSAVIPDIALMQKNRDDIISAALAEVENQSGASLSRRIEAAIKAEFSGKTFQSKQEMARALRSALKKATTSP